MIMVSFDSGVYPAEDESKFTEGSKKLSLYGRNKVICKDANDSMCSIIEDLKRLHSNQLNTLMCIYSNPKSLSREDLDMYLNTLHDIGEKWQRDISQLEASFSDIINNHSYNEE